MVVAGEAVRVSRQGGAVRVDWLTCPGQEYPGGFTLFPAGPGGGDADIDVATMEDDVRRWLSEVRAD